MKTITQKQLFENLGEIVKVGSYTENQIWIFFFNGSCLFSYGTLVAAYINYEEYYFTNKHDYSATTSKYVKSYCGFDASTRRKMLETELATLII